MVGEGLWRVAKQRGKVLPPRERRPRLGKLVQIDGSPHDWFEERGPRCTLIAFIDDATSRVMAACFTPPRLRKPIWMDCTPISWPTAARQPSTATATRHIYQARFGKYRTDTVPARHSQPGHRHHPGTDAAD